jgi:PAS domain S-box-containing protein
MSEPALRLVKGAADAPPDSTSLLEAQKIVLEKIVRGAPLRAVLASLCAIVEEHAARPARAAILLVADCGLVLRTGAAPSLPDDFNSAVDGIAIHPDVGTCCAAAARRQVIITRDIAEDPGWRTLAHLPLALGLRAAWSMPIYSSAGNVLGTFGTYFEEIREPSTAEIQLVEVLSRTAALAIEREANDTRLRESEARYRAIVEATPECVKVVGRDGALLQMNAAGLAMIEAGGASVLGHDVYALIAPQDRERFRAFNESVCAGHSGTLEFDIIGMQGTRRTMETSAVPLPTADGGFVQLAATRDVTARRQAEFALTQNRSRLDYAVRLSGVGFWHCELPFDSLNWDHRVKEHFFFPPDANITIDAFYERIHPEDRESTLMAIEASMRDRVSYDVVYRTVHPDTGDIKWIRALGGMTFDAHGHATHFDGVTVDVTAQKRDQLRLADALARVSEQDRRKDEFLATLAHELRNPLAPIRTGLSILQRGGSSEQMARTREMMERQLRHLVRMVDDLLDISRVTLGKVKLKKERVDFRAVLHSALETTRPLIERQGHEFAVRLPEDPLPLDVDPTRLAQVFANLLNNASKYTPRGGRLQLTAGIEASWLVVRVADNGVGIPAEMLPRVFDLFMQVGGTVDNSQGGLGIGLTLVRALVELHQGFVMAESAGAGLGTTMTVRLPLASLAPESAAPRAHEPPSAGRLKILVVDDNVDAATSLAMLLELEGHATSVAHSGLETVTAVNEFLPDVVFLDIGLPDISGYEVARRLRSAQPARRIPRLIALTGWGSEEDRRQAQSAGFDAHLIKPVDPRELGVALSEPTPG